MYTKSKTNISCSPQSVLGVGDAKFDLNLEF